MGNSRIAYHIAKLKHENPRVRASSVETLKMIGDASVIPALIGALQDENNEVRRASATALQYRGDASAAPALIEARMDEDWLVRDYANFALYRIGATAIPALNDALKDENSRVRESATFSLMWIGAQATAPTLREALKSAVPALMEALKDANSNVRKLSAQALGKIGDNSGVPALMEAWKDEDSSVRNAATLALTRLGIASVPDLITVLEDEDRYVGSQALQALLNIADASAVPALIEALRDKDNLVCLFPIGPLWDGARPWDFPVEVLVRSLKDRNNNVCERSASVLATVGVAAVPALVGEHQNIHRDNETRARAIKILQKIGDSMTLPRKILASSQFSAKERIFILDALRRVRDYKFDDIRTLCQTVINEEDAVACLGAQTVLHWLNGEKDLLHASMPASPTNNKNLLIPHQGEIAETHPETLLLPSSEPEQTNSPRPQQPSLWERWSGKRK